MTYNGNTYTWQNGRELATLTNASNTISYRYNDVGIRRAKIVNGTVTRYHVEGSKVIYETVDGSNDIIYYSYDEVGQLIGIKHNSNQYWYIRNGQNDIIGILDNNLQQVVSYIYDTWGNIISIKDGNGQDISQNASHIGNINPYRYRRI